ncbi:hypothetical protein AB0M20_36120 [Actinoplanes sp. NPDC051633]|uniref:hypothetical protein n=1 Tax=Actinoplanes sp. NPDC051633 TaxID=3155670 RepID=UPI003447B15D
MVEVDRTVNRYGSVSLGRHQVVAADILGGRRVSIRIETTTLSFFDREGSGFGCSGEGGGSARGTEHGPRRIGRIKH